MVAEVLVVEATRVYLHRHVQEAVVMRKTVELIDDTC
jgi:hypothetical protein